MPKKPLPPQEYSCTFCGEDCPERQQHSHLVGFVGDGSHRIVITAEARPYYANHTELCNKCTTQALRGVSDKLEGNDAS